MKKYVIIVLAIIIIGCHQKSNNSFKEFPKEFELKGNVQNEIHYRLGTLGIHDTLLIATGVNVQLGSKVATIFDLNTMTEITQAITVGNGPDEVAFAIGSKTEFGSLYIYDMPKKKLYQYDLINLINGNEIRIEYDIDEDLMFFDFLPEQNFLLSCPNRLDSRSLITYIGFDGKIKKTIPNKTRAYPRKIDEKTFRSVSLYQYTKHPFRELYAFSFRYTDRIIVVDDSGNIQNSNHGPLGLEQTPNDDVSLIEAYRTVRCCNDYIYALYYGKDLSYIKNGNRPELSYIINVFDWRCQPIAQLIFDHEIMDFVIDEINNRIITWSPTTGTIVSYNLPNLI